MADTRYVVVVLGSYGIDGPSDQVTSAHGVFSYPTAVRFEEFIERVVPDARLVRIALSDNTATAVRDGLIAADQYIEPGE